MKYLILVLCFVSTQAFAQSAEAVAKKAEMDKKEMMGKHHQQIMNGLLNMKLS